MSDIFLDEGDLDGFTVTDSLADLGFADLDDEDSIVADLLAECGEGGEPIFLADPNGGGEWLVAPEHEEG